MRPLTGVGLGAQVEAEWIPLLDVSYDPRHDAVTVAAENSENVMHHPRQIPVAHDPDLLRSIEVVEAQGEHYILLFRTPLALPS